MEGLLSTGYDYSDNPYFKNIQLEIDVEGQKVIRKNLLQSLIENPNQTFVKNNENTFLCKE